MAGFIRKKVRRQIDTIGVWDLEGKLEDAIQTFVDWREKYQGSEWSNLGIALEGLDYEGPDSIVLYGERFETDKEYERRVKRATLRRKEKCK